MIHKVEITKRSQRQLDNSVMRRQVERICERMTAGGRGSVWTVTASPGPPPDWDASHSEYAYVYRLRIIRTGRDAAEDVKARQVANMLEIGQAAGNSAGWEFPIPARHVERPESTVKDTSPAPARSYANVTLNTDRGDFFSHIYEREPQIEVVHSALRAFIDSAYVNRFHSILYGEPACGKTEILRSFSRMVGSNAVLELDATSTTKAGAERILLESAEVPPILICEEIEKTDEASLRWLLGVLDHRGEIRKTTHGGGLRQRSVKMLCLGTVNDYDLFRRVMDGALASRFSNKVYCPRPSRDVLRRILGREIDKTGGHYSWIDPAVSYCLEVEGTSDPRRVITVCLCGRDKLLTGEYQTTLNAVREPDATNVKDFRSYGVK